jgi:Mn-containing catalase
VLQVIGRHGASLTPVAPKVKDAPTAEAIGRTLATRLYELTDDPGMQDMLRFLIARDTMHQQQWLAVLEELGPEMAANAPGDFENEAPHDIHAYSFFNHLMDETMPLDARWTSGPSLDGKGTFTVTRGLGSAVDKVSP